MKEEIISFETAKIAKEKGFDIYHKGCYSTSSENERIDNYYNDVYSDNSNRFRTSAPTQSLLQRWLREENSICVTIRNNRRTIYKYSQTVNGIVSVGIPNCFEFYEEALEKGLQEALKLIGLKENNKDK